MWANIFCTVIYTKYFPANFSSFEKFSLYQAVVLSMPSSKDTFGLNPRANNFEASIYWSGISMKFAGLGIMIGSIFFTFSRNILMSEATLLMPEHSEILANSFGV